MIIESNGPHGDIDFDASDRQRGKENSQATVLLVIECDLYLVEGH